jgi:hypothetical protein
MSVVIARVRQRARYVRNRYGADNWRTGEQRRLIKRVLEPNAPLLGHMEEDSRTLLIAFGGMRGGFGMPHFEFSSLTESLPVKRLLVRDLRQAWYHQGIPGYGDSLLELAGRLREMLAQHDVDRLVTTGNSAGGYAALVFGTLLGADSVLCFAPQTVLEAEALAAMDDHRWDDRVQPLTASGVFDTRWTDLRRALAEARRAHTRYEVYFGNSDRADRLHAERLVGLEGVRLYRMGESRHFVTLKMRESGALEQVLRRALALPQRALAGERGTA